MNKCIDLSETNKLVEMRYGWMVYNINDSFIGKSISHYGEWSQIEVEFFKTVLSPKDNVIEVGSNIGSHTLSISKFVNAGNVFAFEPQEIIYQNLCANLSLNSLTNCFCFKTALTEKKGEELYFLNLDFSKPQNFGAHKIIREKLDNSIKSNVDTLDNIFPDLLNLRLLKIDVEGMELNVIKGGEKLIRRTSPIIYLENDRVENSKDLIDFISSLDYRLFWHVVPLYNKNNFFKNSDNIFDNISSFNMICIKNGIPVKMNLPEIHDSSLHPLKK